MIKKFVSVLASAALMGSSFAMAAGPAATVSDFSGRVLVNQGKGFVAVTAGTALKAGDKVLVGENSFAVLSYGDCAVSISKPDVISIGKTAACAAGASKDAVAIEPVADMPDAEMPVAAAAALPLPLIFVGVATAATVGIVATGAFKKKNKKATGP